MYIYIETPSISKQFFHNPRLFSNFKSKKPPLILSEGRKLWIGKSWRRKFTKFLLSNLELIWWKKALSKRIIEAATSHKLLISIPSKSLCVNHMSWLFHKKGWALQVRSTFCFKGSQKSFLLKLFLNGEKTGSKVSPDTAYQEMWKYFQPEDYCTSTQIRWLFSRWLTQKRNGRLKEIDKNTSENGKKIA